MDETRYRIAAWFVALGIALEWFFIRSGSYDGNYGLCQRSRAGERCILLPVCSPAGAPQLGHFYQDNTVYSLFTACYKYGILKKSQESNKNIFGV